MDAMVHLLNYCQWTASMASLLYDYSQFEPSSADFDIDSTAFTGRDVTVVDSFHH